MREYSFDERMQMSQGICDKKDIKAILLANIPGATYVRKASEDDDRNGTDYWVYHVRGEPYSVDVKARDEDWSAKNPQFDDLALETWSVIESQIVGWTRNEAKMTDYVLWFWKDTGRWCLVPFAMLCAVFQEMWEAWRSRFQTDQQFTPRFNGGYHSECVFVPRREVWAAIYKRYGGSTLSGRN